MLTVGSAPSVIFVQIGWTVLAEVVSALDDIVLEDAIASPGDPADDGTFFGAGFLP